MIMVDVDFSRSATTQLKNANTLLLGRSIRMQFHQCLTIKMNLTESLYHRDSAWTFLSEFLSDHVSMFTGLQSDCLASAEKKKQKRQMWQKRSWCVACCFGGERAKNQLVVGTKVDTMWNADWYDWPLGGFGLKCTELPLLRGQTWHTLAKRSDTAMLAKCPMSLVCISIA